MNILFLSFRAIQPEDQKSERELSTKASEPTFNTWEDKSKTMFHFFIHCSVKILCQEDKDDIMWEVSRCCSGQLEIVINQKSDKWQYPTLRELRRIIVWWRYLWWAPTFFFLCFLLFLFLERKIEKCRKVKVDRLR